MTNVIEAPRLAAEELNEIGEVVAIPWWSPRAPLLPHGEKIAVDIRDSDYVDVSADIELLRQSLNAEEIIWITAISKEPTEALQFAMSFLVGTETEVEVAGLIAQQLWKRNLEPVVMLVAGESRAGLFRHALSTTSQIGSWAVGSICARRKGLITTTTRISAFGEISDIELDAYHRLLEVEAVFLHNTFSGNSFGQAVTPQCWHMVLMALLKMSGTNITKVVRWAICQKISQGATAAGWKIEDTLLVDESGFHILTSADGWPTREVQGRARPDLLRC